MTERTRRTLRILIVAAASVAATKASSAQPVEDKIAQALQAAPESLRADATIVVYDDAGNRTTLRQGTPRAHIMLPSPSRGPDE